MASPPTDIHQLPDDGDTQESESPMAAQLPAPWLGAVAALATALLLAGALVA